MSARNLVTKRGQLVTLRTWTEGLEDPEGHGEPEFTASDASSVTDPPDQIRMIKDSSGGSTFVDAGGQEVRAGAVFHALEEDAPPSRRADGEPRVEIDDADGEFWTVERVGTNELGTRRLFCMARRA